MSKGKLIAAAATLLLLLGGTGFFVAKTWHSSDRVQINLATKPRKELMPESSKEWLEEHYTNKLGKDEQVIVHFRDNGDVGIRKIGPGDILQEETIFFADGVMRGHSVFAADGVQVVDGFMLREDRTTMWTAKNDGHTVTTTTAWYDGKLLFSVEQRDINSNKVDVEYFYKTGKPWLHYIGTVYKTQDEIMGRVVQAELWNNDGIKIVDMKTDDNGAVVNTYRKDGTLYYTQKWQTFPWYRTDDGSISRSLTAVDIYDNEGKRIVRELQMTAGGGGGINSVIDYNLDGSRIEYDIYYWSKEIQNAAKFDKDGKRTDLDVKTLQPLKLDDGVVASLNLVDPKVEWLKQEKNPSLRNQDGSPVFVAPTPVDTNDVGPTEDGDAP